MEIYLQDSAATEALGRLLGKHASSGDVFCLSGDLGAGKTLLSRGVAVALGAAAEDVNSPTFAIMNVYQGRELEIRHFDLYRLNRPEELEDIGVATVAAEAGHAQPSTTLAIYTQVYHKRQDSIRSQMSETLYKRKAPER